MRTITLSSILYIKVEKWIQTVKVKDNEILIVTYINFFYNIILYYNSYMNL